MLHCMWMFKANNLNMEYFISPVGEALVIRKQKMIEISTFLPLGIALVRGIEAELFPIQGDRYNV